MKTLHIPDANGIVAQASEHFNLAELATPTNGALLVMGVIAVGAGFRTWYKLTEDGNTLSDPVDEATGAPLGDTDLYLRERSFK